MKNKLFKIILLMVFTTSIIAVSYNAEAYYYRYYRHGGHYYYVPADRGYYSKRYYNVPRCYWRYGVRYCRY